MLSTHDLNELVGRRVKLTRILIDDATGEEKGREELDGTLNYVAPQGVQFTKRGSASPLMILLHEIAEGSVILNEPMPTFTSKKVAPVARGKMRQHLLTSHGFALEYVRGHSEDQAVAVHTELHRAALGHHHEG